ncbi:MAG: SurA N-terminal domain-containing protein [Bdellovibrionaceae bacterium]|nr:SurA N-terminal domain-containing protein [Pseudobdellovibrionaceae bacterium]
MDTRKGRENRDKQESETLKDVMPQGGSTFDQLKGLIQSRDRSKKIIGTLLFGLPIIIVFIFFGLPNDSGGMGGGASNAARVNRTFISLADFAQEEQRIQKMQEYYAQMFGQPITFDPERQKAMRRQAVESLVQLELLSQATEKENILVSDKEILSFIQDMNEFKKDGQFQPSYYFQLLEANRLSPATFESKIKKQVQTQRTRQLFEAVSRPSQMEVDKLNELSRQQWNIQFVRLDREAQGKKVSVSDAEVTDHLAKDEFKKRVNSYFEANRSQYDTPEKVSAQVIVANFTPGNAESEKKAMDKINDLQKKSETEDFGQLAQKFSDDVGTKNKKGDLGYFARGEKEMSLEQAAFSLEVGKVSAPVKGFTSFQLVKLTDRKPVVKAELASVERKIAAELIGKDKFEGLQAQLADALKAGQLDAVNAALKTMGLTWEETGFFGLDSAQIPKLSEKELKMAALELSPKNTLSKQLVTVRNVHYALHLKETKTVEADKKRDETKMMTQQASNQMQDDWIQQFRRSSTVQINQAVLE